MTNRWQKVGLGLLVGVPTVFALAGWGGWQWWSQVTMPVAASEPANASPTSASPLRIEVPQGATVREIGEILRQAGLIRSVSAWELWARIQGWQNRPGSFQAGTYELSPRQSMEAIANKIWEGEVVLSSFTIPEGWTIRQMAEYFEAEGLFSAAEFVQATERIPRDRYPWLPPNLPKLEGFLFPDTYKFAGSLTPEAARDQMLDRFEQVALPLYQQNRTKTPYTLLEWVTLASIVEKESVVDQERPVIAAVFARRLREGMPLGADPTVEYGLGIRQTVDQPLTYAQVQTPNPYNTYINPGLPPTPIASPGLASLQESLNPPNTEFLYFMARYDGTHIFSRTLAEHEAAKDAVDRSLRNQSQKPSSSS
ncbi:MAG TPA: endolytic transglycosylase MltG [Synechococcales cyanobacterium M55_K2018_004]|nr:endolytic transglycosylase MltG [Synechococcales cyanobacterium M55_K2018_004]